MSKNSVTTAKQIKPNTISVQIWRKTSPDAVSTDQSSVGSEKERQIERGKVTKKKKAAKKDVDRNEKNPEGISKETIDNNPHSSATSYGSSYASDRSNRYPSLLDRPEVMSVVGVECDSYDSIRKLINAGFRLADRVYIIVPWGNYVVFRCWFGGKEMFYVYDGCACDMNRFRYMNLMDGTAGLIYFTTINDIINYMMTSRAMHLKYKGLLSKEFFENSKRKKCKQKTSKRTISQNEKPQWIV